MTLKQQTEYFKQAALHKLPEPDKPALSEMEATLEMLRRNGAVEVKKTGGILMPFSKPNKGGL